MPFSQAFSVTVSFQGITANYSGTVTGDATPNVDATIAIAAADYAITTNWRAAGLQGWILLATGGAITVETNSTSVPDNTFTLADGKPQFWFTGTGPSNSIETNVTTFYVSNASGASVRFQAYAVSDQSA
jgi:hypothetical protein